MEQRLSGIYSRIIKSELLVAISLALLLIVVGFGLGYENNKIVPINPVSTAHYNLEPHDRLSILSNWDGPIYLSIANHGYTDKIQANFFPLYPITIHIVHFVVPSYLISGLVVAWASFVGAIYFFLKIIKKLYKLKDKDNEEALKGALFFALFPTAVFLMATYTEGLFAFLALAAIYYTLDKKYWASATFLAFLTATHVNGLFVVILIGLLMLEQKEHLKKIIAVMALGCIGFLAYVGYQYHKFHNALQFIHAQNLHNGVNVASTHLSNELISFNGLFLLLVLISAIYWWKKKLSFSIYSILYLLIVLVGGNDFGGYGRYTLMVFPLQIMFFDYFRNKKIGYPLALAISAIFWTFVLLRYVGGYTGG